MYVELISSFRVFLYTISRSPGTHDVPFSSHCVIIVRLYAVPLLHWKSTCRTIFSYTISNVLRGAVLKSFPNPLTASEEKYYIQRYTEGDLEAKHILIERNLRLVAHVIKKYQNLEEDPEDLISIGTIGLIKAVVTFNPDKGNRLAAYASRCVEKATPSVWLHFAIKPGIGTLFLIRGKYGSLFITCISCIVLTII